MKLAVLFSGGKDSCYALYKTSKEHEIACLLSIHSENPDSYMFHTPNVSLAKLQSEALGIPLLTRKTRGEKEKELEDLKALIKEAKGKYKIQGVVTGAIASVYQATRIQRICDELNLWCFNPLWQKNQIELLNEIIREKFEVIITRVSAYPLGKDLLGKRIDEEMIRKLIFYNKKYKISPGGEGGETESFVTYMPVFKKGIIVNKSSINYSNNDGIFIIEKAELK